MAYACINTKATYFVLFIIQSIACTVAVFGSVLLQNDGAYLAYSTVVVTNCLHIVCLILPVTANFDNPTRGKTMSVFTRVLTLTADILLIASLLCLSTSASVGVFSSDLAVTASTASLVGFLILLGLVYFAVATSDMSRIVD